MFVHILYNLSSAVICLSLVLGRFWPWLPRKSSNLFSLLLSQPSHRFTSFLHVSLYLSNPEEALLSTQHFHLPPPLSHPLPSTILPAWPWLPCKSSTLFSLLPSQPYHSLTSFLQPIHISFQFRGVSSFYYLPLSPPPPNPFPSNSSRSSINLSHLQEGLLSIYQFQVRYKLKFINILLKYYQLLDNFSSVSRWRNIPVLESQLMSSTSTLLSFHSLQNPSKM